MDNLIEKVELMSIKEINTKIFNCTEIDQLDNLMKDLTISDKFSNSEKQNIIYWIFNQTETINRKLMEKEKLFTTTVF